MLIYCFANWHGCCIILISGSFTFLCQPLRDALHKLRMTHKKVPAVQLLIIAMLYQAPGETSSKAPPHFITKPGFYPALLYLKVRLGTLSRPPSLRESCVETLVCFSSLPATACYDGLPAHLVTPVGTGMAGVAKP